MSEREREIQMYSESYTWLITQPVTSFWILLFFSNSPISFSLNSLPIFSSPAIFIQKSFSKPRTRQRKFCLKRRMSNRRRCLRYKNNRRKFQVSHQEFLFVSGRWDSVWLSYVLFTFHEENALSLSLYSIQLLKLSLPSHHSLSFL